MIKQAFIELIRGIKKGRTSSLFNVINLVVGFTTFILLSIVLNYELSYDRFNKNYSRIYRVQTLQEDSYPANYCAFSPSAYRYHLLEELPEVENLTLLKDINGQHFTLPNGKELYEEYGYWAENSLFTIFPVKLTEGSEKNSLTDPYTMIISRKFASKIFPGESAVGKRVILDKRYPVIVTGVYDDIPDNSALRASFMLSMSTFEALNVRNNFRDSWTYIDWYNFVLLKHGADADQVTKKIKGAFRDVKGMEKSSPYLYPLSMVHISPGGKPEMIIALALLSVAALLILIVSCINYVNLSLVNLGKRAREIGIRKAIGLSKEDLIKQSVIETVVITLVSMVAGFALAWLLLPVLDIILQRNITINIMSEWRLLLIIGATGIIAGIVSGIYPARVLASYAPAEVMKNRGPQGKGNSARMKKVLVTLQFAATLFLIAVSFIFHFHSRYMINKDLGFNSKDILFSEVNFKDPISTDAIRTALTRHPEITDVTFSFSIPFNGNNGGFISWDGAQPDQKVMISKNTVDYEFINTYGVDVVKGRYFSRDYPSDNNAVVINETALKVFGWDDIDGKKIDYYGRKCPVIGVVKDFHPFTVFMPIPYYIMFLRPSEMKGEGMMSVKYAVGNEAKVRSILSTEMESLAANEPFEFRDFNELLINDIGVKAFKFIERVFIFFSLVAILIAALGLAGLVAFSTRQRTKEIGVRKVMGASVPEIYRMLSTEILWLMALSLLIAFPAAAMVYNLLPGAYKEPLSPWCFIWTLIIVLTISVITITINILNVIRRNPVEALRYE
jgi:putative ABC transport system permease protein